MKFKVGDWVTLIESDTSTSAYGMRNGEHYKVIASYFHNSGKDLIDLEGIEGSWYASRFEIYAAFGLLKNPDSDPINPDHYKQYPIEVIEITEKLDFLLGNAVKYILRAPYKGSELEDLRKAAWYLERKIKNLEK